MNGGDGAGSHPKGGAGSGPGRETKIDAYLAAVDAVVAEAPPLSAAQRQLIRSILAPIATNLAAQQSADHAA